MESSPVPDSPASPVDPAAVQLNGTTSIPIDLSVTASAAGRQAAPESELLPLFELIARSVASALEVLALTQLRLLVLLSNADSLTADELDGQSNLRPMALAPTLEAMEQAGWIIRQPAGREDEREVSATDQGRVVVKAVTFTRQRQIDEILAKLSSDDRRLVGDAFDLLAQAAREPAVAL